MIVADVEPRGDLGLERVVLFSDAVFAIVITLLILPLATEGEIEDVASLVAGLWPRIVAFVVSFLVIGQFWVAHHRLFRHVRRYDLVLVWLNLLTLLGVTFIPFPTALLGGHASDRFAGVFYAASLTTVSLLFSVLWGYALIRGYVADAPDETRAFTIRALVTTVLFVGAVGIAAWLPYAAMLTWLVCLPPARAGLTWVITRRRPAGDERALTKPGVQVLPAIGAWSRHRSRPTTSSDGADCAKGER